MNRQHLCLHMTLFAFASLLLVHSVTSFCYKISPAGSTRTCSTVSNQQQAFYNKYKPILQKIQGQFSVPKKTILHAEHDLDAIESLTELNELSESIGGPDLLGCVSLDEARDMLWDYAQEAAESDEGHDHDHDHHHHHDHD